MKQNCEAAEGTVSQKTLQTKTAEMRDYSLLVCHHEQHLSDSYDDVVHLNILTIAI